MREMFLFWLRNKWYDGWISAWWIYVMRHKVAFIKIDIVSRQRVWCSVEGKKVWCSVDRFVYIERQGDRIFNLNCDEDMSRAWYFFPLIFLRLDANSCEWAEKKKSGRKLCDFKWVWSHWFFCCFILPTLRRITKSKIESKEADNSTSIYSIEWNFSHSISYSAVSKYLTRIKDNDGSIQHHSPCRQQFSNHHEIFMIAIYMKRCKFMKI